MHAPSPRHGGGGRTGRRASLAPKRHGLALAGLAIAVACPVPASSQGTAAPGCAIEAGAAVRVVAVTDGVTLDLDDGRTIRLAAVAAPEPPLALPPGSPWPLAEAARAALSRLALGETVILAPTQASRDRYGRTIAFARQADSAASLQAALLGAGLVRVAPANEGADCLAQLIATEREARQKRLGLWDDPYYAIRAATDRALADRDGAYDLVEGRVVSVGIRGPVAYLDFGRNWRTDFTAVVTAEAGKELAAAGLQAASLEGRRLRLRGWIEQHDGPGIRLTHAGQLELLDDGD